MMLPMLLVFGGSFALCLLLTPLARKLAAAHGLVDHPDSQRKTHARPTPVAGGIAILLAGSIAVAAALLVPGLLGERLTHERTSLLGLLLGAVTICAVGVADDAIRLRGRHKLVGQILAVVIVIQFGLVVRGIRVFDWYLELGPLAVPFTIVWLLGAINSLNLIDGMDGLLSSVGLIIALTIAAMALLSDRWAVACVALALAGALIGFLVYNFPPASVFLGDAGSMLIGLVVGALAIQGSLKGPATVTLAAPAALLTIPFLDTAAAIIRRRLTGRSIYTTDHGHLHHCLLRRGLSRRRVLLAVSLFCLLAALGALASMAFEQEMFALLAALAVVCILVVSRMFGYTEFLLVKKHLGSLLQSLLHWRARGDARHTEVRLQGSADWQELWSNLIIRASELNLIMLRLNVNAPALHEGYHARWDRPGDFEDPGCWHAAIPLTVRGDSLGRLEIIGEPNHEPVWKKIAVVMSLVEDFEMAASTLMGMGVAVDPVAHDQGNCSLVGKAK